ncbi:MAG: response regulator [candidate division NC10 bacterium]|nr:response regulator [candidate division NC10 bacterium]MBI2456505.1 response regulator [candidate division NC10 bacterium]
MGHRVLVVDDHLMSLELVSVLLAQEGNQVLAATSGEVGLCLAAAEAPDLILMDLQLPGMTGYEAIRRLKADPVTAAIPVLALTGSAMKGDDLKVRAAGADGYLTKPLDARVFRETLRRILTPGAAG